MKKLDWYILKKLLGTFIFVVLLLVLIICVIDYTDKNDKFIAYEISGETIWKYYMSFAPYFGALLTPITAFIATVLVTAKLSAQTEIVAILSSGVSFKRFMYPYFVGAMLIGVMSFYLNGWVIPDANKFRVEFETTYIKKPYFNADRNIHFKIGENDYVYLNNYDVAKNEGRVVTLERFENLKMVEKIHARTMVWDSVGTTWTLRNWQKRTLEEQKEIITSGEEMDTLLNLRPADFGNKTKLETTLTMPELAAYMELQLSRGAEDVMIYKIERYIRYMQPFTVVILMFIGVTVAARKSRRGTGYQIALGFLIAFLFIIMFVFAQAIAVSATMPPLLAIWLPNIVFGTLGIVLYNTVPR